MGRVTSLRSKLYYPILSYPILYYPNSYPRGLRRSPSVDTLPVKYRPRPEPYSAGTGREKPENAPCGKVLAATLPSREVDNIQAVSRVWPSTPTGPTLKRVSCHIPHGPHPAVRPPRRGFLLIEPVQSRTAPDRPGVPSCSASSGVPGLSLHHYQHVPPVVIREF